jgi:hypothetical protein
MEEEMQHSWYNPRVAVTCDVTQLKRHFLERKPLAMSNLVMHGIKQLSQKIA